MRTLVLISALLLVLASASWAQTTCTPPGGTTQMSSDVYNMLQTSVARHYHSSAAALVGVAPSTNQMMIDVKIKSGPKNGKYSLWLVGPRATKMLGTAQSPSSKGNVELKFNGSANPKGYTDIAVYFAPHSGDKPQRGAWRLFTLPVSSLKLGSQPATSGGGSR